MTTDVPYYAAADITVALISTVTYRQLDTGVRNWQKQRLVEDLIALVGIRHHKKDGPFMCLRDIDANREDIIKLMPRIMTTLNGKEKQKLYALKPDYLHRNIATALLRCTGKLGIRKNGHTKIDGKWRGCMDWQIL